MGTSAGGSLWPSAGVDDQLRGRGLDAGLQLHRSRLRCVRAARTARARRRCGPAGCPGRDCRCRRARLRFAAAAPCYPQPLGAVGHHRNGLRERARSELSNLGLEMQVFGVQPQVESRWPPWFTKARSRPIAWASHVGWCRTSTPAWPIWCSWSPSGWPHCRTPPASRRWARSCW